MKLYEEVFSEEKPSSALPVEPKKEKFILPEDPEAEELIKIEGMETNDLIDACFQGIDLKTYDGTPLSRTLLARALNSAIDSAEQTFDIVITPRHIKDELHEHESESLYNYQYMATFRRPVIEVEKIEYRFGTRPIFTMPKDWIQLEPLMGDVTIFPTSGSIAPINMQVGTMMPLMINRTYMPMAISITYRAGMKPEDIPTNLLVWIYKMAAIDVLQIWGDQIIGAGIANQSLSIDGLSQSTGTTQSAMYGGASARINDYREDMKALTPIIRKYFYKPSITNL